MDQYRAIMLCYFDHQYYAIDKGGIFACFDLYLSDLDLDLCDLDLYHILSLTYQYQIMKQPSQNLSLCLNCGPKLKIHYFVTFDLENVPSDLKINRLRPLPIPYQGTKYQPPGSNHVRKKWATDTQTHRHIDTQTHRHTYRQSQSFYSCPLR